MREELKPCPFCGGEAELLELPDPDKRSGWTIRCCYVDDFAYEQFATAEETIAAWNARPEADTVTRWQDISTAPKDGTWFLGYTPRRVHGWPWQNSKGAILSFRWWGKGKGDRIPWFSNMDGFPQPTHWMPLPPAPEKETNHD